MTESINTIKVSAVLKPIYRASSVRAAGAIINATIMQSLTQGFLSPAPDGVNAIFTIPDLPMGDAMLFDQIVLREGVGVNDDYTRVAQTITFNAGKQPASGAKPFMLYVKSV